MWGSVWEWCDQWYFPAANFLLESAVTEVPLYAGYQGSERIVKGGSRANPSEEIEIWTRGSQPPAWCTPHTGFRLVLSEREP
jgi:formylglycine-generating enzyme required for sulfatase activity